MSQVALIEALGLEASRWTQLCCQRRLRRRSEVAAGWSWFQETGRFAPLWFRALGFPVRCSGVCSRFVRIVDVCHRQLRDSCGGSRNPPRDRNLRLGPWRLFCRRFLRRQREGVGPWRGSRRSSGIVPAGRFRIETELPFGDGALGIASSISWLNHPQDWKEQEWRPEVSAMNPERANPLSKL